MRRSLWLPCSAATVIQWPALSHPPELRLNPLPGKSRLLPSSTSFSCLPTPQSLRCMGFSCCQRLSSPQKSCRCLSRILLTLSGKCPPAISLRPAQTPCSHRSRSQDPWYRQPSRHLWTTCPAAAGHPLLQCLMASAARRERLGMQAKWEQWSSKEGHECPSMLTVSRLVAIFQRHPCSIMRRLWAGRTRIRWPRVLPKMAPEPTPCQMCQSLMGAQLDGDGMHLDLLMGWEWVLWCPTRQMPGWHLPPQPQGSRGSMLTGRAWALPRPWDRRLPP